MATNKTTVVPAWVLIAIGALAVFLFIKYCTGGNVIQPIKIDNTQHVQDSIEGAKREQAIRDTANRLAGQLVVARDSMDRRSRQLTELVNENKRLITRYRAATYPVDTSATLVPAAFIDDCETCFSNLERTNQAMQGYKQQSELTQQLSIDQSKIDSTLISELQDQKLKLNKDYNDMRMAAETNGRLALPKRQFKIGLSGQLNSIFLPKAVGPSVMYQDKKGRSFDAKALYGSGPTSYVVSAHAPLFSF